MKRFLTCVVALFTLFLFPVVALSSNIPILEVTSPLNQTYTFETDFTQAIFSAFGDVTGELQYVGLGGTDSSYDLFNAGNIALIQRGTYTFVYKTQLAQAHGAIGVLLFNSAPQETLPPLVPGGTDPLNVLPVLFTTHAIGDFLLDYDYTLRELDLMVHMKTVPLPPPVPEPSTMLLLGSGLVGLVGYGRRRLTK